MSFFTGRENTGGLSFIKKEEKAELAASGTSFTILRVSKRAGKYSEKEFLMVVELDGEERGLSFPEGSVESRDRDLTDLIDYLDAEDAEPVIAKLAKAGLAYLVVEGE